MLYIHTHTHTHCWKFCSSCWCSLHNWRNNNLPLHKLNSSHWMLREGRGGREGKTHKCSRNERVESLHVMDWPLMMYCWYMLATAVIMINPCSKLRLSISHEVHVCVCNIYVCYLTGWILSVLVDSCNNYLSPSLPLTAYTAVMQVCVSVLTVS